MNPIVFITGATSGFGRASAEIFARHGYSLILNGRRQDRLAELEQSLKAQYNCQVLLMPGDVRDQQLITSAIEQLPEPWRAIDVLVNNAGLALGRDYFDEADLDDWNVMVDTNVKGFMYVARAVSRLMAPRKQGHIINIGSIAGMEVYEKGNVYCATKFAVGALSQAMRLDLLRHHIRVTAILPGAAETEFSTVRFKGDEKTAAGVYDGLEAMTAEDVAGVIHYVTTVPPHVCVNELVVMPTRQADATHFNCSPK